MFSKIRLAIYYVNRKLGTLDNAIDILDTIHYNYAYMGHQGYPMNNLFVEDQVVGWG